MTHALSPNGSSAQTGHPPQFTCDVRLNVRASAWIRLTGELDAVSASQLKQALERALDAAVLIIVDLRELTFMDSAGAHEIAAAHDRARHSQSRLVIVRGPALTRRLLDLVGISNRLSVINLKPILIRRTAGAS